MTASTRTPFAPHLHLVPVVPETPVRRRPWPSDAERQRARAEVRAQAAERASYRHMRRAFAAEARRASLIRAAWLGAALGAWLLAACAAGGL